MPAPAERQWDARPFQQVLVGKVSMESLGANGKESSGRVTGESLAKLPLPIVNTNDCCDYGRGLDGSELTAR